MENPVRQTASCHCGAVRLSVSHAPTEVTDCNCSLCRSYGVLWTYWDASDVGALPEASLTDAYAWGNKHVDFHRCRRCGCVTHWVPRDASRGQRGINGRLFAPEVLAAARVRHKDGAGTGEYLD